MTEIPFVVVLISLIHEANAAGYSQRYLASLAGVNQSTIMRLMTTESVERLPNLGTVLQLQEALATCRGLSRKEALKEREYFKERYYAAKTTAALRRQTTEQIPAVKSHASQGGQTEPLVKKSLTPPPRPQKPRKLATPRLVALYEKI